MQQKRHIIRKTHPHRRALDEQFWPVILALFVLSGFLLGAVTAYLDNNDPRWYRNAYPWLVGIPLLTCLAIAVLRRFQNRFVRRGVQLSAVLCILLHAVLFVVSLETDIFGRFWQEQVTKSMQLEVEPIVEPDYQAFNPERQQREIQQLEQPVEVKTPDSPPQLDRMATQAEPVTNTPSAVDAERQLRLTSPLRERPTFEETVPRFSETPSALHRADREQATPELTTPVETPTADPIPDPTRPTLNSIEIARARREATVPSRAPSEQAATEAPRPEVRVVRRDRTASQPNLSLDENRNQRRLAANSPQSNSAVETPQTEVDDRVAELAPSPLSVNHQTTETAPVRTAETSEPDTAKSLVTTVRVRNAAPRTNPEISEQTVGIADRRPLTNRPMVSAGTAAAEATQQTETRSDDVQPTQLARIRSLAGVSGVGQSPNLDRALAEAASPSLLASGATRRTLETQTAPPGPALAPNPSAVLRRSIGQAPTPKTTLAATTDQAAPYAGSQSPEPLAANASASLEKADAHARPATTTAAAGTIDVDLGATRVVGKRGANRAAGGGQPEIQLANQPRATRATRSNLAPPEIDRPELRGGLTVQTDSSEPTFAPNTTGDVARSEVPEAMSEKLHRSGAELRQDMTFAARQPARQSTAALPTVTSGETGGERKNEKRHTSQQPPQTSTLAAAPHVAPERDGEAELKATGSQVAKQSRSQPTEVEATSGPGGLRIAMSLEPGVRNRRASRDATLIQPAEARFQRRNLGGPPSVRSQVVVATEPFRNRARRLSDDSQPGGSSGPETEEAIERGLAFLAKHQHPDGSWSLQSLDGNVGMASDTAATGLALLAFQGAGYNHREHQYAQVVSSAIEFLVRFQQDNGDLFIPLDDNSNRSAWLYSHGIAALAFCEAYGMTQDPELRRPAQRAIDFIVEAQDPVNGGWRYSPGTSSDTSVTGWMWMALQSAELAELQVPDSCLQLARRWADLAQATPTQRHLYRYNPFAPDTTSQRHGRTPSPTMTSVGLLMRLYDGWHRDHPVMVAGAGYLASHLPAIGTTLSPQRDTYYWYYGTQVMFHMGGEPWRQWQSALRPLLLDTQIVEGDLAGSWNPWSPVPDRWSAHAGRLYVTTMNLLSLEVHYRHLPIYEETGRGAQLSQ